MATSSIIENIRVNNPQVLEDYVAAMETSRDTVFSASQRRQSNVLTDSEAIRQIAERALARRGQQA